MTAFDVWKEKERRDLMGILWLVYLKEFCRNNAWWVFHMNEMMRPGQERIGVSIATLSPEAIFLAEITHHFCHFSLPWPTHHFIASHPICFFLERYPSSSLTLVLKTIILTSHRHSEAPWVNIIEFLIIFCLQANLVIAIESEAPAS